ncbi:MAG: hypothetical protein SGJ11_01470 [Phycisphaerae bacterium]|nr:hypothetical protein [Phycisphaerae bacterium]
MRNVTKVIGLSCLVAGPLVGLPEGAFACPPTYDVEVAYFAPCGFSPPTAFGLDINDAGDVAGYVYVCGKDKAFVWLAGSPTPELLSMPPLTVSSRATGINNTGQIVGTFVKANQPHRGFAIQDGVFTDMGTMPGGNWSETFDNNDSGQAVGFWGNVISGPGLVAMRWQTGSMQSLGRLFAEPNTQAEGINNDGVMTGFVSQQNYAVDGRAFILNGKKVVTLPAVEGGYTSFGRAINNLGQVAGWGHADCDPPQKDCISRRGFFWNGTQMVAMEPDPALPDTYAHALNDSGAVVGYMANGNTHRGFVWEDGQLNSLTECAGLDGIVSAIPYAYGINASGQITGMLGSTAGFGVVRLTRKDGAAGDLNCDGAVGPADMGILLGDWGSRSSSISDLNGNGVVDAFDLGILLGGWDG